MLWGMPTTASSRLVLSSVSSRHANIHSQTLTEQAGKLLHTSNVYHNEWAGKLAELLVTLTQNEGGLGFTPSKPPASDNGAKVFFSNSGTEANEGALKIARKVGK